jgi:hypothetical protein
MKLMKMNQKELTTELKGMTGSELLALYNGLEYKHRISTNGRFIWDMILRSSGSREYKSVHR